MERFFTSDILSKRYGREVCMKAILFSFIGMIVFTILRGYCYYISLVVVILLSKQLYYFFLFATYYSC